MPTKGNCTANCCCNDCSRQPEGSGTWCCACVCDALCVDVSIPGPLTVGSGCDYECGGCVNTHGVLLWDEDLCGWSGTVNCGSIAFDLFVKLVYCNDDCVMCVTSNCLDMTGTCLAGTGSGVDDCFSVSAGSGQQWGGTGCGNYRQHCAAGGGELAFNFTHAVGSGCFNPALCSQQVTMAFECAPRVNPMLDYGTDSGTGVCRDCDCICETVCITWTEDLCSEVQQATWDGEKFSATFGEDCSWSTATVEIRMEQYNPGGTGTGDTCCWWTIQTSRGGPSDPEALRIKTSCPSTELSWTIDETGTGTGGTWEAVVDVTCAYCDECRTPHACCPEDNTATTLYLNLVYQDNDCPTTCIPMSLVKLSYAESIWRGEGIMYCSQEDSSCYAETVVVEYTCIGHGAPLFDYTGYLRIYCDGVLTYEETVTQYCRPFCYCGFLDPSVVTCTSPDGFCQGIIDFCLTEECREMP